MKSKVMVLSAAFVMGVASLSAQTPLWQGKGRIAVSSDGNEHDHDDWAATPLTLAMIASQGLQDRLVVYTFSDHIWGSNQEVAQLDLEIDGMTAYDHMRASALGGKKWFQFDNSRFVCAVDNANVAYRAMCDAINASSEDNPLFILAAGPMQVVGEALNMSDMAKRKFVTVISHSGWNNNHADEAYSYNDAEWIKAIGDVSWDNHTGWTFDEMRQAFGSAVGGSVRFVQIADQNGGKGYDGFCAAKEKFEWIKSSAARNNKLYKPGSWEWLYSRIATCEKEQGKSFDPSDAGLAFFLLTGIERSEPEMARDLLEHPKPRQ